MRPYNGQWIVIQGGLFLYVTLLKFWICIKWQKNELDKAGLDM